VAEHSFFVAVIAREMYELVRHKYEMSTTPDGDNMGKVLESAILHDVEESCTGDIPFLVKRHMVDSAKHLKDLALAELDIKPSKESGLVKVIVKFADIVDLKIYLEEERNLGNNTMHNIERETFGLILEHEFYRSHEEVRAWVSRNLMGLTPLSVPDTLKH
jgi:5'-deoxynucleotidase YfbR-like HD superfamily hydrolase